MRPVSRIVAVDAVALRTGPREATNGGQAAWTMLRVEAADGTVGWGEGPRGDAAAWAAAARSLAAHVEGEDPQRIGTLLRRVAGPDTAGLPLQRAVLGALDVALHDLVGQQLGVPAYELLGGRYRDRVPVYHTLAVVTAQGDPAAAAAEVAEARAAGFRRLKVRIDDRPLDPSTLEPSTAYVAAVREAVGASASIIVELGPGQDPRSIVRFARMIAPLDIAWIELHGLGVDAMRSIVREAGVPVCQGGARGRHHLLPYLEAHVVGTVSLAVPAHGLSEGRRMADLAGHFDALVCADDRAGPVGLLASAQLCTAFPATVMMGVDPTTWAALGDVLGAPLAIMDGDLVLLDGPGLGARVREEHVVRITTGEDSAGAEG